MLLQKQPNTKKQFFLFIILMVMMSMIGIFSSDVYLPSMPAMASYFSVDYSLIQKTITVYLIALALFQLFYGALSDHIGRRPVVITGVIIYCAASIACALYPSLLKMRKKACSGIMIVIKYVYGKIIQQNKTSTLNQAA